MSREITKQLASHPILKDLSCAIKEPGRAILKGKGKATGTFNELWGSLAGRCQDSSGSWLQFKSCLCACYTGMHVKSSKVSRMTDAWIRTD